MRKDSSEGIRACLEQCLRVELPTRFEHACENAEEFGVVERADAGFLANVIGELGHGTVGVLFVDEQFFGEVGP